MASVGIGRQHKAWRFFVIIFASQFACLSRNRFPISTSALPGRHLACLLSVSNDILDLCLESESADRKITLEIIKFHRQRNSVWILVRFYYLSQTTRTEMHNKQEASFADHLSL